METGNLSALSGGLFAATTAVYVIFLRSSFMDGWTKAAKSGSNVAPPQYTGIYIMAVIVIQLMLAIVNLQSGRCKGSGLLDDIYTIGWAMLPWIAIFGFTANMLGTKTFGHTWRRPFSGGALHDFWGADAVSGVNDFFSRCCSDAKGDATSLYKVTSALDLGTYFDTVNKKGFPGNIVSGCTPGASLDPRQSRECNKSVAGTIAAQIASGIAKRDIWSNTIWYLMAGSLSTVIYATAIASAKCELSPGQMKEIYESNMKDKGELDTESNNKKIYVSHD
jgi:hypothetical protein